MLAAIKVSFKHTSSKSYQSDTAEFGLMLEVEGMSPAMRGNITKDGQKFCRLVVLSQLKLATGIKMKEANRLTEKFMGMSWAQFTDGKDIEEEEV